MHGAVNSEGDNLWVLEGPTIDLILSRAMAKLWVSESFDNYEFFHSFSSLSFC